MNDEAQIFDNKSRIIRLETEMLNNSQDLREVKGDIRLIKDNHLAHIQKSIEDINLKLAKLEPQNKIVYKVIEYVIMSVVVAVVSFIVVHNS